MDGWWVGGSMGWWVDGWVDRWIRECCLFRPEIVHLNGHPDKSGFSVLVAYVLLAYFFLLNIPYC